MDAGEYQIHRHTYSGYSSVDVMKQAYRQYSKDGKLDNIKVKTKRIK